MIKRTTLLSGLGVCMLLLFQYSIAQTPFTLAHRLLTLELTDSSQTRIKFSAQFKSLDTLIQKARKRIGIINQAGKLDRQKALTILQQIDSVFSEQHFFTCLQVEFLSEALIKNAKEKLNCRPHISGSYRTKQWLLADSVFKMDCDIGSILYASVAQCLNIPLYLVEVPKHNFVRWQFDDGTYLNWDINEQQSFSNEDYRLGRTPATYLAVDTLTQKHFNYLTNLDTTAVKGYYTWLLGRYYKRQRQYGPAKYYYQQAINYLPGNPLPKMCLAYLYTFHQAPESKSLSLYALALARDAALACPQNPVYIETLACSYARLGRYDEALQTLYKNTRRVPELEIAFTKKQRHFGNYRIVD